MNQSDKDTGFHLVNERQRFAILTSQIKPYRTKNKTKYSNLDGSTS